MRTLLVMLLGLAITAEAAKKPSRSGNALSRTKKQKKSRKYRRHVNRDQIREESISAWPLKTEVDSRLAKVGVPELDRLLVEHPPLGAPVADDPASSVDSDRHLRMASDDRDRGVATVAMSSPTDPLVKLKQVAEPLLGSPYRTGGSSANGFDCSGFVLTILHAFGQNLTGRSSPEFYKQGIAIDKDHLQTGDLLYFADHRRSIGHVGIYLAEGKFIHASVGAGVIVSGLDEKYYKAKYKAARRLDSFAQALGSPEEILPIR